jgi:hypothetical protein
VIGAAIGAAGGVLYAAGILWALRTWWIGAIGTETISLHVSPTVNGVGRDWRRCGCPRVYCSDVAQSEKDFRAKSSRRRTGDCAPGCKCRTGLPESSRF